MSVLLDHHRELLAASALTDDVIAERGYWSAVKRTQLADLGFKPYARLVPALVIPIRDDRGEIVTYQIRPDQPRISDTGRPVKYETPAGSQPALDVPARCRRELRSPTTTLWITEGARKADAAAAAGLCCVSLPGVWSWAKRLNDDARTVLPALQRVPLHERKVVIAFDSDVMVKPAVHAALEALAGYLTSQGTDVQFAYLPELEPGVKSGLDDLFAAGRTLQQLWEHVEPELRELPVVKRKTRAPMATAHLLHYVENLITKYVRVGEHERTALVLWVLHTWVLEAAHRTPYLLVISAAKRSGKTRLLEVLELAVKEPLRAASITEAALFQSIEAFAPTLMIDEVDAIFTSRSERAEALRGVLNAGNARGSYVIRGTQDGTPVKFETFCPKVLAGIDTGKLPDTIRDRCIVTAMERKLRDDDVERLRAADLDAPIAKLRGRLSDWGDAHLDDLAGFRLPAPVEEISDRLEEGWEPLFAIAALAGDPWPERARAAAITLAGATEDVDVQDHGLVLLAALKGLFADDDLAFASKVIVERLNRDEELPFGAFRHGAGIDQRGLSRLLRPYKVKPRTVRIGTETAKGYHREQLLELWDRYLPTSESAPSSTPPPGASQASHASHARAHGNGHVTDVTDVTDEELPHADAHVSGNGSPAALITADELVDQLLVDPDLGCVEIDPATVADIPITWAFTTRELAA